MRGFLHRIVYLILFVRVQFQNETVRSLESVLCKTTKGGRISSNRFTAGEMFESHVWRVESPNVKQPSANA